MSILATSSANPGSFRFCRQPSQKISLHSNAVCRLLMFQSRQISLEAAPKCWHTIPHKKSKSFHFESVSELFAECARRFTSDAGSIKGVSSISLYWMSPWRRIKLNLTNLWATEWKGKMENYISIKASDKGEPLNAWVIKATPNMIICDIEGGPFVIYCAITAGTAREELSFAQIEKSEPSVTLSFCFLVRRAAQFIATAEWRFAHFISLISNVQQLHFVIIIESEGISRLIWDAHLVSPFVELNVLGQSLRRSFSRFLAEQVRWVGKTTA